MRDYVYVRLPRWRDRGCCLRSEVPRRVLWPTAELMCFPDAVIHPRTCAAVIWMLLHRPARALGPRVANLTPFDVGELRTPAKTASIVPPQPPRGGGGRSGTDSSHPASSWVVLVGRHRADTTLRDFLSVAKRNTHPATMRFGYVDLAVWPGLAAELEVDPSLFGLQVPSVLQLDGVSGAILRRLPLLDEEGNAKHVRVDAKAMTIHFGVK